MSNFPVNTLASVAGPVNAQRNESARVERHQQIRDRQRQEEVEDLAEDAVLAIRDREAKEQGQEGGKQPQQPVDVAELRQEDGSITEFQAPSQSQSPRAVNRLDISA